MIALLRSLLIERASARAVLIDYRLTVIGAASEAREASFRNDAVRANRKGNDNVVIDDEENAVLVGDIKVENLVSMPEDAGEFVTTQRRMSPVR
jgi:hypothetical protein